MPIYEQSVNVRNMIRVRWHATWRILASYVGTAYFRAWSRRNILLIFRINFPERGISS